jgi:hypothetical protein
MLKVRKAAETLIDSGYVLAEDLEGLLESAAVRYDYFSGQESEESRK